MELSYWVSRWNKGKTGFHMKDGYPGLERHWPKLNLPHDPVVLVPLAGKSKDILWLSERSQKVIAVEISERAIHQFLDENQMKANIKTYAGFDIYTSSNISLWHGDFMKLPEQNLPPFDLVYDKGSMVALPPGKRNSYSNKLLSLSSDETHILMHLFSYPQNQMPGPPFSVSKEEIEQYFGCQYQITELESSEPDLSNFEKFRRRGLKSNFFEFLLLLSRKQSI